MGMPLRLTTVADFPTNWWSALRSQQGSHCSQTEGTFFSDTRPPNGDLVDSLGRHGLSMVTGENLDAVPAVKDSFKMADAFADDRTGVAVTQTSALTVDISETG